jgi:hypothetical protein
MSEPNRLCVEPRLARPDDFYQALMDLHRDLDAERSALANAQLILLLANHVGDEAVLEEAIAIVRGNVAAGPAPVRPA